MITPRRTRLIRAPDLAGFRARLVDVVRGLDLLTAADTFVLVPTRAAAEQLRRTLEDRLLDSPGRACVLPRLGTRADLYAALAARLPELPRLLAAFEREVLLGAAAHEAEEAGAPPPFYLRPALVAEMLALYDHVRRQHRTIADFERLLVAELEPAAETDRGAAQLLEQTRFLVAAFTGYERRLADSGGMDEHGVRGALLAVDAPRPLRHVVISVGDRLSDPDGLWPADVAMFTAIGGLVTIDVLSTEAQLSAGYLERVRLAFVGIDEVGGDAPAPAPAPAPTLVVPAPAAQGGEAPLVFSYRDREEELEGVARRVKAEHRSAGRRRLDRVALVVPRPLPYLYLARDVFGGAGLPFEALDTLPLAAEPYAAALDLVLDFVATGFTRSAAAALLRSPHFRFVVDAREVGPSSVSAADRSLAEVRYLGTLDRLASIVERWTSTEEVPAETPAASRRQALPALRAALDAARFLAPLLTTAPLVDHLARLVAFLEAHDRESAQGAAEADRRQRVRAAVLAALGGLADAYRRHDPGASGTAHDVVPAIRRWLGAQTFATRTGEAGLQIIDPQAARFGEFDDVQLMGLVEGDWPEQPRRNIFYPQALLLRLEPSRPERVEVHRERDLLRAGRAAFRDLLGLARARTRVSTFSLESDAVVEPSVLIEDVAAFAFATERAASDADLRVFAYEALALAPQAVDHLPAGAAAWARARVAGAGRDSSRFHGEAGPWVLPRVSVSRLERYLKCPFQFYASNVLRLEEEPEDEDTRSPLERGRFLHELFETFFHEWQHRGHGRITPDTLAEANALFADVCEPALEALPRAEAALERARLFGSAVGPGIAERVFVMEAERVQGIRQRLMEYPLEGDFTFAAADGSARVVPLRAKIDRVDLLEDGSFRLIDYKMKYVPDVKQALQLPIYSACVRRRLSAERGRDVSPSEAMYLSLEGDKGVVRLKSKDHSFEELVTQAEHRLVGALDDIAAGHFPPRPSERQLCGMCAYVTVCREPGGIGVPSGGEGAPPGDTNSLSGRERTPSGNTSDPSGDERAPSGGDGG